MTPRKRSTGNRIVTLISISIAAVFLYAGADKLRNPGEFADSIAAFAILPTVMIAPIALALPLFEIASGLLILFPGTRRIGLLATILLSILFFSILLSALARGLVLDCGCFGAGTTSRPRMWLELGLDAVLFSASLLTYLRSLEMRTLRAAASPSESADGVSKLGHLSHD